MIIGAEMFAAEKRRVIASLSPELSELEIKRRLVEHFYGDEIDVDAFIAHLMEKGKK